MSRDRICFSEMYGFFRSKNDFLNSAQVRAGGFSEEINNLVNDRSLFQCKTAEAMAAYWTEVHGSVLRGFQNSFSFYLAAFGKLMMELNDVDSNEDAFIESNYLFDYGNDAKKMVSSLETLFEGRKAFTSKYGRFLTNHHSVDGIEDTIIEELRESGKLATEQDQDMGELNHRHVHAFDEVERLLDGIEGFINCKQLNVKNYTPGKINRLSPSWLSNMNITEEMVDILFQQFFNLDGTIDYQRIGLILRGEGEHLSDVSFLALVRLFIHPHISYDDIANIIAMSGFPTGIPINPIEIKNASNALALISQGLFAEFSSRADLNIFQRRASWPQLEGILDRAQLVKVLGILGSSRILESICVEKLRSDRIITVNGMQVIVSEIRDFMTGQFTGTNADRARMKTSVEEFRRMRPTLFDLALGRVQSAGISAMNKKIPGVSWLYSALNHSVNVRDFDNTLHRLESLYERQMFMNMVIDLGGGTAWVSIAGELHFLGYNLSTNQVAINMEILYQAGYSQEQAIELAVKRIETLQEYLCKEGVHFEDVTEGLGTELRYNKQFADINLTQIINLPLPVLLELIKAWREGR